MFCPKCGTQNSDAAKFCKKCGNDLKGGGKTVPKKKTKIYYIVGSIVIILALIGAILLGIRGKKAKEYDTYLASAEKYIEELDYEQAEDFYLKAIHVAPKKLKPYVQLAEVYISNGEVEKAKVIIEEAKAKKAKGDEETESKLEEIIVLLEEVKDMVDYQWVLEPTIEANDIYYTMYYGENLDETYNTFQKQFRSPYAVIDTGEGIGLIDMTGKMVVEPDYKEIRRFYQTFWLVRKEPVYTAEVQGEWELFMWDETKGIQVAGEVGEPSFGTFFYSDGLGRRGPDDYYPIPKEAIPVQQMNKEYELKGPYAVYHNERLVTDFIYDECGSSSEGLLAVCKDEKWGYVNEEGEVIIPLEYDTSWDTFDKMIYDDTLDPYCYAASDGYVTLHKDGEWELRDIEGKLAIPSGIFEEILPVYEGKCWVKMNGKWGVIELIKDKNELNESKLETLNFEELPREFVFSSGAGAWATVMGIDKDGTFTGNYHDSEAGAVGEGYPRGTVFICDFSGKFTQPEKVTEYIYRMKIEYIELKMPEGEVYFEDEIKYITTDPYGLEEGEFYIYLPGTPIDEMDEEFMSWGYWMFEENDQVMPEGCYGIFNTSGAGFTGTIDNY